jgi:hypothetical protein
VEPQASPSSDDVQAAERLVEDLLAMHPSLHPAIDWSAGSILIAATPPVPADVAQLDGSIVAGLRVEIVTARVSIEEYESFIEAVGAADFENRDRVQSFNLPAGSGHIEVKVRGLRRMPADDLADLRSELERLTSSPLVLIEWTRTTKL